MLRVLRPRNAASGEQRSASPIVQASCAGAWDLQLLRALHSLAGKSIGRRERCGCPSRNGRNPSLASAEAVHTWGLADPADAT